MEKYHEFETVYKTCEWERLSVCLLQSKQTLPELSKYTVITLKIKL